MIMFDWLCLMIECNVLLNETMIMDIHRHVWYHDMDTLPVLLALCEWNLPVTIGFPLQSASNANIGVSFAVCLNNIS